MSILCLATAGVGRPMIDLLSGEGFTLPYGVLLMLLPGIVALTPPKVINSYLVSANHAGITVCASGLAVGMAIVLDLLLIPRWGPAGAAIASSASYALFGVVVMGFHRLTGVG